MEDAIGSENSGTLVLNVHPSISDSKGLFIYANDALGHLNRVLCGQLERYKLLGCNAKQVVSPFVFRTITPTKMHSNIEETVDIGNGMTFMEKLAMFKHMIMFAIPWKSPYMKSNPAPIIPDYATRHIQVDVPIELSRKILKSVETNGVSLHAVWTAAAGIAMHEMLNLTTKTKLNSTHEVDLRVLTKNYDSKECKTSL